MEGRTLNNYLFIIIVGLLLGLLLFAGCQQGYQYTFDHNETEDVTDLTPGEYVDKYDIEGDRKLFILREEVKEGMTKRDVKVMYGLPRDRSETSWKGEEVTQWTYKASPNMFADDQLAHVYFDGNGEVIGYQNAQILYR